MTAPLIALLVLWATVLIAMAYVVITARTPLTDEDWAIIREAEYIVADEFLYLSADGMLDSPLEDV